MRVSDFDSFETQGLLSGSKERSWIWFGLIVSLAIHFALCAYFYRTRFAPTEAAFVQNELLCRPRPMAPVSGPSCSIGANRDRSFRRTEKSVPWPATGWAGIHESP